MAKHPGFKKNKYGVVHTVQGIFRRAGKTFYSVVDALREEAKSCQPCGCDPCLGYWTQTNAQTGELMAFWISGDGTGGDPYVVNVDTYDNAKPILKALFDARP